MKEVIRNRLSVLDSIIQDKTVQLENAPKGTLRVSIPKNKAPQYYHRESTQTNGRYLNKSESALIKALAQKRYNKAVLHAAKQEYAALITAFNEYPDRVAEDVFRVIHPGIQHLVTPVQKTDQMILDEWNAIQYDPKPFTDNYPEYYTESGERVRSKSEVLIADLLHRMEIPYHYECPLRLNNTSIIYPDFTILHIRKRKIMYLEHLGMMDDAQYSEHAAARVLTYERCGIYLGDKLVLTWETRRNPINVRLLEQTFRFYFM